MNAQLKLIRAEYAKATEADGGRGIRNVNNGLSNREWDVMLAIAKGESPSITANRLGLSAKTVATYRARIVQKTGLRSNAEIAVTAHKQGLIE